jgi:hypothetical protein
MADRKRIPESERWVGVAASVCALLALEAVFANASNVAILISPLGIYCSLLGLLVGGALNRVCGVLSMLIWLWLAITLLLVVSVR